MTALLPRLLEEMNDWFDKDLPESVRNGQRLTTMTSGQARFPIAPSIYKFSQHGQSRAFDFIIWAGDTAIAAGADAGGVTSAAPFEDARGVLEAR